MTAAVVRVLAAAGVLASGSAWADTPRDAPAALEVDREAPPPGRAELGFDGGAPVAGSAASVTVGLLARPITLTGAGGETHPVDRRETLGLGAALGLGDAAVLDARITFARQTGDRLVSLGDARALDRWVPGDLRIGGRARVVSTSRVDALVRADLTLPTGDDHDFAGEAAWSVAWSLIGRARLPAGIVVAAAGGIRLRGAEVMLADRVIGDELHGAVGVAVPIPPVHPLWCEADQVRLTGEVVGVLGDEVGGASGPSPAEARFGVVTRPLPALTIGVRVGAGLGDQIGAPAYRAMFEVTYHGAWQLIPPRDPDAVETEDADSDEQ